MIEFLKDITKKYLNKKSILLLLFSILLLPIQSALACNSNENQENAYIESIIIRDTNDSTTADLTLRYCGNQYDQPPNISIEPSHITAISKKQNSDNVWAYTLSSPKFDNGGFFPIKVSFLQNGQNNITIDNNNQYIHINKTRSRHISAFIAAILIIALASSKKIRALLLPLGNHVQNNQKTIASLIIIIFSSLVLIGITGSSIRFLLDSPSGNSFIETKGSTWSIRSPHPDRGDEWLVITPSVLAQINHTPSFPIINSNVGVEGQNMGVIGMTGVPIKQIAAVARPATWGYFFLPLRQAMSWHWQFPFFFALLTLWWLLNIVSPLAAGRNLALAFAFCVAPYAAAWSNWPLYATAFPVLGFCLAITLLKSKKTSHSILLGLALGWTCAAWVLVLYPPWLVIVGTLCLLLFFGWILDNKKDIQWSHHQLLGLICTIIIAGGILFSWWIDTQEAISLLRNTVYPGGRQTESGGGAPIVWTLRGYVGLEIIPHSIGPEANKSEASSYFYAPLAIATVLITGIFRPSRMRWTWIGLCVFFATYWWYSFIGFPVWLAEITKWGVLTTNRMDLGLGLGITILIALLGNISSETKKSTLEKYLALIIGILSLTLTWWIIKQYPPNIMPYMSNWYILAMALLCGATAWWTITKNAYALTLSFLIIGFATSASFNPISKAPREISLQDQIKEITKQNATNNNRTLVVDESTAPAMALEAMGLPVINGVLYYPHKSLWESMKINNETWPIVNRYQHLTFTPSRDTNSVNYSISSPSMDSVNVQFNPLTFSFREIGARRVVAYKNLAEIISINPELEQIYENNGYIWFSVRN